MSKHTVLKPFIDNETLVGYHAGNTFESEDLERVSFLSEEGYIHIPNNKSSEEDEPTVKELKEKAKLLGLKGYSKMKEEELIAAIEAAEAEKASE